MKLYDYELSGNCYKVRYLLHALALPFEKLSIDFHPGHEHKSDWFIANINPAGQLPALEDDGLLLRDAQAILVYLASRYDSTGTWYPDDARSRGEIQMWLATAEDITRTASAARLHRAFGYDVDLGACQRGAHDLLRLLDDHLAQRHAEGHEWLLSHHVTIADLACFPYAALAPEGGIVLDEYSALRRWLWTFRSQPGFIGMSGILVPKV